MTVYRQKMSDGSYYGKFRYEFTIRGKRYRGKTSANTKKEAKAEERQIRSEIEGKIALELKEIHRNIRRVMDFSISQYEEELQKYRRDKLDNNATRLPIQVGNGLEIETSFVGPERNAIVKSLQMILSMRPENKIESEHKEITAGTHEIPMPAVTNELYLDAAFETSLLNRCDTSTAQKDMYRRYWNDFIEFLKVVFPACMNIPAITNPMVLQYMKRIRETGFFRHVQEYNRGESTVKGYIGPRQLSNHTLRNVVTANKATFNELRKQYPALLPYNPWDIVNSPKKNDVIKREIFSGAQVAKIIKDYEKNRVAAFLTLAMFTGLRASDVAGLRWDVIDQKEHRIRLKTGKTKSMVTIPILPQLDAFLKWAKNDNETDYVLPDIHERYDKDAAGVVRNIRCYLESIGIETQRKIEGRSRNASIKGMHSARHTFCTLLVAAGLPINVVRHIVGHSNETMTAYYADHETQHMFKGLEKQLQNVFGDYIAEGVGQNEI